MLCVRKERCHPGLVSCIQVRAGRSDWQLALNTLLVFIYTFYSLSHVSRAISLAPPEIYIKPFMARDCDRQLGIICFSFQLPVNQAADPVLHPITLNYRESASFFHPLIFKTTYSFERCITVWVFWTSSGTFFNLCMMSRAMVPRTSPFWRSPVAHSRILHSMSSGERCSLWHHLSCVCQKMHGR